MQRTTPAALCLSFLLLAAPFGCLLLPRRAAIPAPIPQPAATARPGATAQFAQPAAPTPSAPAAQNALAAQPVQLYDAAIGARRSVEVVDFLVGAAACEMPPTWPEQALLAQMVASHSYVLSLGETPFSVNSALCAGWCGTDVLQSRWGDDYETHYTRLRALAEQVCGALLLYGGEPAAACYHAISNGRTEASQNVWGGALPYLQGVDSRWDTAADGYETEVTYTPAQLQTLLNGAVEQWGDDPAQWFGAPELDAAGYVARQTVCGTAFAGTALRRALGLRSTDFSVRYNGETFCITTRGYGHGVGLSQHGARAMAQGGADWREILAWYFPGTTVEE